MGTVDAIVLFDVLLHQADPDWREILKRYAENSRVMIVYNPQWTGSRRSVRLVELGREEWLKNTAKNFDEKGNIRPNRQSYFQNADRYPSYL